MYSLGNFRLYQKDEVRVPSALPKIASKINNPLRKLEPPAYELNEQSQPKNYPVKFNIDLSDPANWGNQPPQTTAKAWTIFDCKKMLTVHSKNLD